MAAAPVPADGPAHEDAPEGSWCCCHTADVESAQSIIVVGYAKVSQTSAARSAHEYLAIVLRVDRDTGRVLCVDSTAATALVRDWIAELLTGVTLTDDVGTIIAAIDRDYVGHGAGSIKQATVDAWRRYEAWRHGGPSATASP